MVGRASRVKPGEQYAHGEDKSDDGDVHSVAGALFDGEPQFLDVVKAASRVWVGATVGDVSQQNLLRGINVEHLAENVAVVVDIVETVLRFEAIALVEAHVDEFDVSPLFGNHNHLGPERAVDDVVFLDIRQSVRELRLDFEEQVGVDGASVDEFTQRFSVDVVGDYAHAESGNRLEVVNHHDVRVRQVVAHVEFFFEHHTKFRLLFVFRLEALEHHPFAVLFNSVNEAKFFFPFGQKGQFAPFAFTVGHSAISLFRQI